MQRVEARCTQIFIGSHIRRCFGLNGKSIMHKQTQILRLVIASRSTATDDG
jgi:hypothetical protein